MSYLQALQVLQSAARYLENGDGNLSHAETVIHASALAMAFQKVTECHASIPSYNAAVTS